MPHIPLLPTIIAPLTHTIIIPQTTTHAASTHKLHPFTLPDISLLAPLPNHPPLLGVKSIKLRIQSFLESLDRAVDGIAIDAVGRVQDFPRVGALPGFASFEDDEEGV